MKNQKKKKKLGKTIMSNINLMSRLVQRLPLRKQKLRAANVTVFAR